MGMWKVMDWNCWIAITKNFQGKSCKGGYMKFHELPRKWKITVTILRILAVALPIAFILNVWMTLGSLIMVMVG